MTTRICTKCNEEKPIEKFNKFIRKGKEYREHTCMACRQKIWRSDPKNLAKSVERTRSWHEQNKDYVKRSKRGRDLKRLYGITIDQFDSLLKEQDFKCKLCGTPHTDQKYLHVDHCHTSGHVRGLLCTKCNTGLGLFNEDLELLTKAMQYLKENKL
jgi:hypothetical protein